VQIKLPKVRRDTVIRILPLAILLAALTASFVYGWYYDDSHPHPDASWHQNNLYTLVAVKFAHFQLPDAEQVKFAPGYPLLGAVGHLFSHNDPFVPVSYGLLAGSLIFCYLAVRHLFGTVWACIFSILLFAWDGYGRTFNYASELFVIPWNNQVLFFAMAFFFWLFTVKFKKKPSYKLLLTASFVAGFTFLTREETVLFVVPIMAAFLYFTKSDWKKWLICYVIIFGCFVPQVLIKQHAVGGFTRSGRTYSYSDVRHQYLQPSLFYRNVWGTIIDSKHFYVKGFKRDPGITKYESLRLVHNGNPKRLALLQAAPWLWIAPIGIGLILAKRRYPLGLKLFMLASVCVMAFYLSGVNMSAYKLKYHCLRYISSGFIALNLGVIVTARESQMFIASRLKKQKARTVRGS
jgi:hypothetical protein